MAPVSPEAGPGGREAAADPERPKALVLFSGGLDSILAARVLRTAAGRRGLDIAALHFINPFTPRSRSRETSARAMAAQAGVTLHHVSLGTAYLRTIEHPRFGRGKNLNPCIDCRIFMMRYARELLPRFGAHFLASGEVLGQRPMSQRRQVMRLIDAQAGVEGWVVRPLSARHLKPTIPEERGWILKDRLLDIQGRSRQRQMELAERYGITRYPSPAGGCLLTTAAYSRKVADLLEHGVRLTPAEVTRLQTGRHFRLSPGARAIVGRNHDENLELLKMADDGDLLLEAADYKGPLALALGELGPGDLESLAAIVARYCDAPPEAEVRIKWRSPDGTREGSVTVSAAAADALERRRM